MTTATKDINANSTMPSFLVKDEPVKKKGELGQEDFMRLMLEQLKAQDPMDPQDNGDFIAQMAQFSQLDGINKLNTSFENVVGSIRSTQALQASAMVGHTVQVEAAYANLHSDKNVTGAVVLPTTTTDVRVTIKNAQGEVIQKIPLGKYTAGTVPFEWNGLDKDGNRVAPGKYEIVAEGTIDGKNGRFATRVGFNVDSVAVGGGTVLLNLEDHGTINMSDVREIS